MRQTYWKRPTWKFHHCQHAADRRHWNHLWGGTRHPNVDVHMSKPHVGTTNRVAGTPTTQSHQMSWVCQCLCMSKASHPWHDLHSGGRHGGRFGLLRFVISWQRGGDTVGWRHGKVASETGLCGNNSKRGRRSYNRRTGDLVNVVMPSWKSRVTHLELPQNCKAHNHTLVKIKVQLKRRSCKGIILKYRVQQQLLLGQWRHREVAAHPPPLQSLILLSPLVLGQDLVWPGPESGPDWTYQPGLRQKYWAAARSWRPPKSRPHCATKGKKLTQSDQLISQPKRATARGDCSHCSCFLKLAPVSVPFRQNVAFLSISVWR